jgi:hypothetical protein
VYKIAFYKLENYHQCPLRVVLMEQFGYSGKLFLPQFIGLLCHEYFERVIGRLFGVDEPFVLIDAVDRVLRGREPVFDLETGIKSWEAQPIEQWQNNLLRLLSSETGGVFRREYEKEKPIAENVLLRGVCDVFIERDGEREIIDLKFTRKKHRYSHNQLLVYSYLFEAQRVSFLFFEPNGDVEKRTIEVRPNNATLNRLLGEMRWLAERIGEQNFAGFRPKHGSTCHPNRCAMWDYCPAVQIGGKDGEQHEEHSDWEGLEGLPAEDELCFDEE